MGLKIHPSQWKFEPFHLSGVPFVPINAGSHFGISESYDASLQTFDRASLMIIRDYLRILQTRL